MPSEPGWTSWTRSIAHWSGTRFGCFMSTSWLVDSWVSLLAIHLVRTCREWRYSLLKIFITCAKNVAGFALRVATAAAYFRYWRRSSQHKEDHSKSCQPRNVPDLGTLESALNGKRGRELRIASISQKVVCISSKIKWALPTSHMVFDRFYGCLP